MEIKAGICGEQTITVTEEMTAMKVGSGLLPVYATPQMIALIECTAKDSIQPLLDENQGSVGTLISVSHVSATPVGMKVTCHTTVTEVDRKRIVFTVEVKDEAGLIGKGTHERFLIENGKFMEKVTNKRHS